MPSVVDFKEMLAQYNDSVHVGQFTDVRHFRFKALPENPRVVVMTWRKTVNHVDWEGGIKFFDDVRCNVSIRGLREVEMTSGKVLVGLFFTCLVCFSEI
jgi:hypothetical protein